MSSSEPNFFPITKQFIAQGVPNNIYATTISELLKFNLNAKGTKIAAPITFFY